MKTSLLALAGALALLAPSAQAGQPMHAKAATAQSPTPAPRLQAALRELWQAHVVHTRDYAFAAHAGRGEAAREAEQAVVANARQIADAIAGYYGRAAGDRMLQLLSAHWGAVKEMTQARQSGDAKAGAIAMQNLTGNAREIATFLSGANPHLSQEALLGLLVAHGAHHAAQIEQVMAGDLEREQATWAAMQAHMRTIADALAAALAKQFPDRAA